MNLTLECVYSYIYFNYVCRWMISLPHSIYRNIPSIQSTQMLTPIDPTSGNYIYVPGSTTLVVLHNFHMCFSIFNKFNAFFESRSGTCRLFRSGPISSKCLKTFPVIYWFLDGFHYVQFEITFVQFNRFKFVEILCFRVASLLVYIWRCWKICIL